jgi:hypothetical protein
LGRVREIPEDLVYPKSLTLNQISDQNLKEQNILLIIPNLIETFEKCQILF